MINEDFDPKPQRAKQLRYRPRQWMWPRWLKTTAIALLCALIALVVGIYARSGEVQTTATPPKVVYRDWPVYIPQAPQECLAMLDSADQLYDVGIAADAAGLKVDKLVIKGMKESDPATLIEAGKAIKDAEEWIPKRKKARELFLDQYQKCAEAK